MILTKSWLIEEEKYSNVYIGAVVLCLFIVYNEVGNVLK